MQTASSFIVKEALSKDYAVEDRDGRLCVDYTYKQGNVERPPLSPFF